MPLQRLIRSNSGLGLQKTTTLWIGGIATLIFLIIWLAPIPPREFVLHNYAPWHAILEIFSVSISATIFSIAWQSHAVDDSGQRLRLLGAAFLAVALLDIAHLLSFSGMPYWFTPSGNGKAIPFWFLARYASIFGLLFLTIPRKRQIKQRISPYLLIIFALIYTAISYWLVLAHKQWLPVFIVKGKGLTGPKILLEWSLVLLFAFTLIIIWRNRHQTSFYNPNAVMLAVWLSILSELCFTLYSNVSGLFNILGHVYKVGAYAFLYQGIVITSIKLPYRLLTQNRELLQQLTDNIQQVFWLSSADKQTIFYISPAYEKVWNQSCQSLYASPVSWMDAIHPDDIDHVRQTISSHPDTPYTEEYRILTPDGTQRWILDRSFPIHEADGHVERIAGLAEDITLRKQLEQSIADRERTLRNLIDSLPSLISYWNKELINVFTNKSYMQWFGRAPELIKGLHISDLLGDDFYKRLLPHIHAALDGKPQQFEETITTQDGVLRHTLVTYTPDISNNQVLGFYAMISDITHIKKAEQQLRDNEAMLSSMISVMAEGILMQDKNNKVVICNPAAERILGISRDELKNLYSPVPSWHAVREDGTLFSPDEYPSTITLQTGESQQNVIMGIPKPDNNITWISINSQPVLEAKTDLMQGVVVSFHDITNRKKAETDREALQSQLMQAQKMESIGHLTGGIAHDFNNMLGAMLGYAELLKQMSFTSSLPPQRVQKYLAEILTAGNRAKELISQMLIFSRLNPEDQNKNAPSILIQPVIKEVVQLLRSSIPSNIGVIYHIPDETLKARIHPVQLHQIVLNLAINARDAITDYGTIDITVLKGVVRSICQSCHQAFDAEYVDLRVTDNGQGIAPDNLNRIFDPFFTTKEVGKGSGMGLSVVHGIVHAVGGHISIISQVGHGTMIRVLLPVASGSIANELQRPEPPAQNTQGKFAGLRVMVVDDEHSMVSILDELLSLHGAIVSTYTDPTQALTILQRDPDKTDLLITDETMPHLTGLDLAIAALKCRPKLPIILCTGYSDQVNADVAAQHGIAGFMLKPVKLNELVDKITQLIHIN